MANFIGKVSTPYVGSEYEFEFDVDDEELGKCANRDEEETLINKALIENMWMQEAIQLWYVEGEE